MINLRNFANGFLKIENGRTVFLTDPWVTEGIFDGGWSPYPPIRDAGAALRSCDYLYISHIHEDHFDMAAISYLPRECTVIIPDLFPNHLIQQRMEGLGFKNIRMLKPLMPTQLARNLTVEIIPPLNAFAQELRFCGYWKSICRRWQSRSLLTFLSVRSSVNLRRGTEKCYAVSLMFPTSAP